MIYQLSIAFILFIIYSFVGWLMEVVNCLWEKHRFINRGFLIGPICPIYGVGSILLITLLTRYSDNLVRLFIHAIIVCSILEYMTSYFMEKIFHARWWDYSHQKFNLNGRICAKTMIPFGIFGTLIVGYVNPFLYSKISLINPTAIEYIALVLFLAYLLDSIVSTGIIINIGKTMKFVEKDATEQITTKVRGIIESQGKIYARIFKSFPSLINTKERLIDIRDALNKELAKFDKKKKKKEE